MGKYRLVVGLLLSFVLALPLFAHADNLYSNDLPYQFLVRGFYWGTKIATPSYNSSSGSYGATLDVKFRQGSGMENWGFGADFVSIANGPRLINTGGAAVTTFNGVTGAQISQNGVFGLVVPGNIQFGGGKVKYFFPTANSNVTAGVYVCAFSQTGALMAYGLGGELGYSFNRSFDVSGFVDANNSTGNGFPSQTLIRYQAAASYTIPDTSLQAFLGYRGMTWSNFNNTYINGVMAGVGARF